MQILIFLIFGTINAIIASKKGFNPLIWFFAAGLLGLIVLAFLPSAKAVLNENEESYEQRKLYEQRRKTGNRAGIIILCVAAVLILVSIIILQSL